MARREVPKEDLVRDATAFATRVEFRDADREETFFFGLRSDGGASIYFADESFVAFNPAGEIRRAFDDGTLYKAERGRLVPLRRERSSDASALVRGTLSDEELAQRLDRLAVRLTAYSRSLRSGRLEALRAAGDPQAGVDAFRDWLDRVEGRPLRVAETPGAGGS